eukprot:m.107524 g.107524  ORF g.107524 m.107524 type:complete len:356 (-) comp15191_c0_seq2:41-1108(-)
MRQANSSAWAVAHIQAVAQVVGWDTVSAVEVGNENDLFHENGIRPTNYTYDEYAQEFGQYAHDLTSMAGLPQRKIQGGTFCCHTFDSDISSYIKKYGSYMTTFSYHRYPTSACNGGVPKLSDLMSDESTKGQADMVQPWVQDANAQGITFVLGEGNSCSCGGYNNISNTMASALWSMDFMFNLAAVNVSMTNFHGGGEGAYTAIGYHNTTDEVPDVRPLYYSMLAFTEITRNYSRIFQVDVKSTSNAQIKTWAVQDDQGYWRVVIIHKDYTTTTPAQVNIDITAVSNAASAQLYVLESENHSIYDKYGLTWAGQTFDGSQDGRPVGTRKSETVHATASGILQIAVIPCTIAVLEF